MTAKLPVPCPKCGSAKVTLHCHGEFKSHQCDLITCLGCEEGVSHYGTPDGRLWARRPV